MALASIRELHPPLQRRTVIVEMRRAPSQVARGYLMEDFVLTYEIAVTPSHSSKIISLSRQSRWRSDGTPGQSRSEVRRRFCMNVRDVFVAKIAINVAMLSQQ
jgi:hypothetical protein